MRQAVLKEIYSAIAEYSAAYEKVEVLSEPVKSVWMSDLQECRESILDVIHAFEERV